MSDKVFQSKPLAKEACRNFVLYFRENYPAVKNLKCRIDPCHRQVIARAKYNGRKLYARSRTVRGCLERFIAEYYLKVRAY